MATTETKSPILSIAAKISAAPISDAASVISLIAELIKLAAASSGEPVSTIRDRVVAELANSGGDETDGVAKEIDETLPT